MKLRLMVFELKYCSEYSKIYQIRIEQKELLIELIEKFKKEQKSYDWYFCDVVEYLESNGIKFYEPEEELEIDLSELQWLDNY